MDPEADYKPFEVVEGDGRTILRLRGTKEQRERVEADKVHLIMNAIAQGWDIDIIFADIEDDLDLSMIAEQLERSVDEKWVINGNIRIASGNIGGDVDFRYAHLNGDVDFGFAHFGGDVDFRHAHFGGDTYFWHAHFGGDANFRFAQFNRNANFISAHFSGDVDFISAHFSGDACFGDAQFSRGAYFVNVFIPKPANFADVTFRENHVLRGLWNATLGRIKRLHWQATDFSGFNTEKFMDGASNPWLKRYIDDELWIESWRERSWWRKPLFIIWELTSHCGRSIGLWAFWSVLIAVVFAFVYQAFGGDSITFSVDLAGKQPDLKAYLYYSVVTFTTLGFGDIIPKTNWARLAVGAEVVLGYVMLDGLISIFANKLARRS